VEAATSASAADDRWSPLRWRAVETRSNVAQRVVAVIALGAVLWLVGSYLTSAAPLTGWTGYAPLRAVFPARDGLSSVENLFVWIGIILGWLAASVHLLRPRALRGARDAARHGAESAPAEGERNAE
jgi:hypothetical protein